MSINDSVKRQKAIGTDGPFVLGCLMDLDMDLPFFDSRDRNDHQAVIVMSGLNVYLEMDSGIQKEIKMNFAKSMDLVDWYSRFSEDMGQRYPEFNRYMIGVLKELGLGKPAYIAERGHYRFDSFIVRRHTENGTVDRTYRKSKYAGTVVIARGDILERKW